jgi:glycosyltransferase involved in cell wall biosynthesis
VVVIDHNDELLRRAQAAFRPIRVVRSVSRPGLCGARNTGLRSVSSEIVAFLDDDARADIDWLEQISGGFDDLGVLGVGGWVEPSWETAMPRWLAPEMYWIVGCSYAGLPQVLAPIRNGIGANMAFRRTALIGVGGFKEGVGQGPNTALRDDETDLAIRVRARWPEAQIMHLPAARVEHSVPAERARWAYLLSRSWSEGKGKAILAGAHGSSRALASERAYVLRVLPSGVARGLLDAAGGDLSGLGRAASIVASLSATVAGYFFGRLTSLVRPSER